MFQSADSLVQGGPGDGRRVSYPLALLWFGGGLLDPQQHQDGVVGDEFSVAEHAGIDEVTRRVRRVGQGSHGSAQQVEGASTQRADQSSSRTEDAVDRSSRRTRLIGDAAYRQGIQAPTSNEGLGRIEQCLRNPGVVFARAAHA